VAPSTFAEGGTTSGALGILWMNPSPAWSEADFIEFYVHELTHMTMFYDDYCYRHYTDLRLVADPANWAQSAIRNGIRPLDKALHSLVVATEILLFRRMFGSPPGGRTNIHPTSPLMLAQAKSSARSLLDLKSASAKILTSRSMAIAETCLDALVGLRAGDAEPERSLPIS
jgi:hypothetical protein